MLFFTIFILQIKINMKNLRKLSKVNLKKINGGSAPLCESGFMACRVRDENGNLIWECLPHCNY
ncbi:hypothetical protein EGY05_07395 [Chryseobacterium arthrosphaerae]|nr:hypothetical protein EGY05_07395 [Chryseobacterium arthrosphaerae]